MSLHIPELFEVTVLYTADGEQWGRALRRFDANELGVVLLPHQCSVEDGVELMKGCEASFNESFDERHEERLERIMREVSPDPAIERPTTTAEGD